jgi:hypothetical protein
MTRTSVTRAQITEGGTGRTEPYARLNDGRVMPMGWNMGQRIEVGTKGVAEYIATSSAGLWRFTSLDDAPPETVLEADRQDTA